MKHLSIILINLFLFSLQILNAQIPRTISYQGLLTDAEGAAVPDDSYDLTFRLYDMSSGGSPLWTETQTLEVTNGVFNTVLGKISALNLKFDKGYWLGITINSGSELYPRIELTSSAYSLNTAVVGDSSILSSNISSGQVVKSINSLTDNVSLIEGSNIIITPSGNSLIIGASVSNGDTLADSSITSKKIASGQVIRSINGLKDNVSLVEGDNINITSHDNALTIAANVSSTANTLDQAYDQGGPGAGRTIIADSGAFEVLGVDGVLFTGIDYHGAIPAEGYGTRMMWYPAKSAFRVGNVDDTEWDDINIGYASTAIGGNTVASGPGSVAMGEATWSTGQNTTTMGGNTTASGNQATAMGTWSTASGSNSVAMGSSTIASGVSSIAMGNGTTASGQVSFAFGETTQASGINSISMGAISSAKGNYSIAIGSVTKANHNGSIVISANLGTSNSDSVYTALSEQMILRADHGMYITNTSGQAPYEPTRLINTSTGAYLTAGGVWTDNCDKFSKENFTTIDKADLLDKLKKLEITQWNYKSENPDIKHIGPVAQDFYTIFGVGNDDKSISTIHPAGIALAAIQELEKRTSRMQQENEILKEKISILEKNIKKLQEQIIK